MTPSRIILIVIAGVILLFAALIIYSLSPTVRNVSQRPFLSRFLNRSLQLQRKAYIYLAGKGQYDLVENVLTEQPEFAGELVTPLLPGATITIHSFKTYTNNLGSGFTWLYAIGEATLPDGKSIPFEYSLGSIDGGLYSAPDAPVAMTRAVWQAEYDRPIEWVTP